MAFHRKLRRRTPGRWAECPDDLHDYANLPELRHAGARPEPAAAEVERRASYPWAVAGRPPKDEVSNWIVTDDWPRPVPVTQAEVDIFEAWFGDVFDELFGPCQ